MTPRTNARIAGVLFLLYIAFGLTSLALFNQATAGAEGTAARLAGIAQHETLVRLTVVITLLTSFMAGGLGVTLYALTRDQDRDLALMALCCRAGEGVMSAVAAVRTLGLLSVATASTAAAGPESAAAQALGAFLLNQEGWQGNITANVFAVGSLLFSYLFLRARSIPVSLAWLGVLASALLVVVIPLQLAGFVSGMVTYLMWLPMLVFEVTLALWLIIKGVVLPHNN
jgi:hypothetical protein